MHLRLRTYCVPLNLFLKKILNKYLDETFRNAVMCVSFRQFCGRRERSTWPPCVHQRTSGERLVEASRRKVLVEARLENRGENAYGTILHITHSANLQFSSLVLKVCSLEKHPDLSLSPGLNCIYEGLEH